MSVIKWNDALSTKIGSIDDQHKKLIDLINTFYESVSKQSSKELMFNLIKSLKEYTVYHFSTEEKYMKQFGFPGYNSHKIEHDKFVEKVLQLEEKFNSGKIILTLEVTFFIKDWVAKHIMETDKQYSSFLIKNGVQ
jgi:hemerythrin